LAPVLVAAAALSVALLLLVVGLPAYSGIAALAGALGGIAT
jgi:hypothetical protein